MNDRELDRLLKSIRVPSRPDDYWNTFPEKVADRMKTAGTPHATRTGRKQTHALERWILGFSTPVAAAIVFMLFLASHRETERRENQLELLRESYRQILSLFPQQLDAIVFAENDAEVLISEAPAPSRSEPVYVRFCPPAGRCVTAVSFSGTLLKIFGREFEILENGAGEIFVVAKEGVWGPGQAPASGDHWRIEGGRLEQHL